MRWGFAPSCGHLLWHAGRRAAWHSGRRARIRPAPPPSPLRGTERLHHWASLCGMRVGGLCGCPDSLRLVAVLPDLHHAHPAPPSPSPNRDFVGCPGFPCRRAVPVFLYPAHGRRMCRPVAPGSSDTVFVVLPLAGRRAAHRTDLPVLASFSPAAGAAWRSPGARA